MSFPVCKHKKRKSPGLRKGGLNWIAAEPYRIFFASGAIWSIIGVSLWPLFYAQQLSFFPNLVHSRLMIESFGGAFVVGFLGTAGPRMATAPKLTPAELIWLFGLHQLSSVCHLTQHLAWGDAAFAALLGSLLLCLVIRVVKFRKDAPPPQMILALTGLVCGLSGTILHLSGVSLEDPSRYRLANLLLYQGLLLPPVLGIGSFVFPRILGGDFGEPKTAAQTRMMLVRALVATALLVGSFFLEAFGIAFGKAFGNAIGFLWMGYALRALVAAGYLLLEVTWKPRQGGSLTTGLLWSLAIGWLGLLLAPFHYEQHIAIEHLLYIGGFGMLILIVGSRVLFGHSGDLDGFFVKSNWVRFLLFLGVLTAITRAVVAWIPSTMVSHHIYAAWTWAILVLFWLIWHRKRFVTRDDEE